jgi:hypothetical protein
MGGRKGRGLFEKTLYDIALGLGSEGIIPIYSRRLSISTSRFLISEFCSGSRFAFSNFPFCILLLLSAYTTTASAPFLLPAFAFYVFRVPLFLFPLFRFPLFRFRPRSSIISRL